MRFLENTQNNEEFLNEKVDCQKCPGIEQCSTFGYLIKEVEYEGRKYEVWEKCAKREKIEAELKYQKALRTSGIPKEYLNKNFENFEVGQNKESLQKIKRYLDEQQWKEGKGLVLIGPVGVGKTHLSAAILHELAKKDIFVLFIFVPDFLDELRETYDEDFHEEEDKFELVKTAQVLILDDLGTERITDWAREKIIQLLNYRYNNSLPTIVTTNLTMQELKERIGERAFSRLLGISEPIPILGEDRRLKNVTKRKS